MDETAAKVRENLVRRRAERRGLRLEKSRRRDRGSVDYGTYQLTRGDEDEREIVVHSTTEGYGLTLDEVERHLDGIDERRAHANTPWSTYIALTPEVARQQPTGVTRSAMLDDHVRVDYGPDGTVVGVLFIDAAPAQGIHEVKQVRPSWPGFDLPTK